MKPLNCPLPKGFADVSGKAPTTFEGRVDLVEQGGVNPDSGSDSEVTSLTLGGTALKFNLTNGNATRGEREELLRSAGGIARNAEISGERVGGAERKNTEGCG